jgi:hypothetical protein
MYRFGTYSSVWPVTDHADTQVRTDSGDLMRIVTVVG